MLERDDSWAHSLFVCIYGSITCWKPSGQDVSGDEVMEKDVIRCSEDWTANQGWRRDYVWVQEYTGPDDNSSTSQPKGTVKGMLVGQVMLIFRVQEYHARLPALARGQGVSYPGALLDVFKL